MCTAACWQGIQYDGTIDIYLPLSPFFLVSVSVSVSLEFHSYSCSLLSSVPVSRYLSTRVYQGGGRGLCQALIYRTNLHKRSVALASAWRHDCARTGSNVAAPGAGMSGRRTWGVAAAATGSQCPTSHTADGSRRARPRPRPAATRRTSHGVCFFATKFRVFRPKGAVGADLGQNRIRGAQHVIFILRGSRSAPAPPPRTTVLYRASGAGDGQTTSYQVSLGVRTQPVGDRSR